MSRVTVVGAGVYGCLTALELSRAGFKVTLVDRQAKILQGASRANQGRLHRGYHYPRSPETMEAAQRNYELWHRQYPTVLQRATTHAYALATDSRLTWDQYLEACRAVGLEANGSRFAYYPELRHIHGLIYVEEAFVNFDLLEDILIHELFQAGVRFKANYPASAVDASAYPVVDCTYGRLRDLPVPTVYEITELVVVKLPSPWENRSLVVMDGPFGVSIDPTPWNQSLHHLYHVDRSVRSRVRSSSPYTTRQTIEDMATHYAVDRGPIQFAKSAFRSIVREGSYYVPDLKQAEYIESLFTIRAVRADTAATDARPSEVWDMSPHDISVLGGKIGDAIETATRVASMAAQKWL